jgi:hypothetical protein
MRISGRLESLESELAHAGAWFCFRHDKNRRLHCGAREMSTSLRAMRRAFEDSLPAPPPCGGHHRQFLGYHRRQRCPARRQCFRSRRQPRPSQRSRYRCHRHPRAWPRLHPPDDPALALPASPASEPSPPTVPASPADWSSVALPPLVPRSAALPLAPARCVAPAKAASPPRSTVSRSARSN